MVTISIDGPKALHEEMRGLPGSFDKGHRNVPAPARHPAVELSDRDRHDADGEERRRASTRRSPRSARSSPISRRSELHLNVGHESGHYFDNVGYPVEHAPRRDPARGRGSPEEERLVAAPGEVPRGSLPGAHRQVLRDAASRRCRARRCRRRASSTPTGTCIPARSGSEKVGNLRDNGFDLRALWDGAAPPRAARGRRRGALLALLDAVRGLSDDPRPSRSRRRVARACRAAADPRRNPLKVPGHLHAPMTETTRDGTTIDADARRTRRNSQRCGFRGFCV